MDKKIMAVDAGFTHSGVAVLDTDGKVRHVCCISTEKDSTRRKVRACDDLAARSAQIFKELSNLVKTHDIAAIVVEMPSGGSKSLVAGRAMGMAIAIVSCVVEASGLPGVWITPAEGKKAAGGHRNASKQDVQTNILKLHPELHLLVPDARNGRKPAWFEHVCDAVAAWEAAKDDAVIKVLKKA